MTVINADAPNWAPIERVMDAGVVPEFTWMCTVEIEGTRIEQYKHRNTKRYLNLDADGNAYRVKYDDGGWTPWDGTPMPEFVGTAERIERDAAMEWALS